MWYSSIAALFPAKCTYLKSSINIISKYFRLRLKHIANPAACNFLPTYAEILHVSLSETCLHLIRHYTCVHLIRHYKLADYVTWRKTEYKTLTLSCMHSLKGHLHYLARDTPQETLILTDLENLSNRYRKSISNFEIATRAWECHSRNYNKPPSLKTETAHANSERFLKMVNKCRMQKHIWASLFQTMKQNVTETRKDSNRA